jgi:hypothetical protein
MDRRLETALFAAVLLAYAWFHQGGGWSQNGRYAMVRAIVEERTVAIDDFLIYRPAALPGELERVPVRRGVVERDGRRVALSWERGLRVTGEPEPDPSSVPVRQVAVSGDLVFSRGRFHPNKAPGTAFLAVPGYAALHLLGVEGDSPKALAIGAWLTGVFSVGLLAALAVVVFHRLARDLWPDQPGAALLATATFAFGTMYFPYATMLFEHDVVAACLLLATYAIRRSRAHAGWAILAGACAGWAAITNYVTAAVVIMLALYVRRDRRAVAAYAAGVSGPFLLICAYNVACFGTPFTTNYAAQNPLFQTPGLWLGVFAAPDPGVLVAATFSPFRGLFVSSPVLLLAVFGLGWMLRERATRREGWLSVAIVAFYLLFTMSFNAWQGGNGVGPRYLVPAVPFLCLALPPVFARLPKLSAVLAAASIAIFFLVTAVDPQPSVVDVPGRAMWKENPLTEYVLPLFVSGRAEPLIDAVVQATARRSGEDPRALRERVDRGDIPGLPLALLRGPVSVNPIGMYEAWFYTDYPPGSPEANGNSFNAGEAVFPGSRLSLLPLLVLEAIAFGWISARCRLPRT